MVTISRWVVFGYPKKIFESHNVARLKSIQKKLFARDLKHGARKAMEKSSGFIIGNEPKKNWLIVENAFLLSGNFYICSIPSVEQQNKKQQYLEFLSQAFAKRAMVDSLGLEDLLTFGLRLLTVTTCDTLISHKAKVKPRLPGTPADMVYQYVLFWINETNSLINKLISFSRIIFKKEIF